MKLRCTLTPRTSKEDAQALIKTSRRIVAGASAAPCTAEPSMSEPTGLQLWDLWAGSQFPHLTVMVHGVQHFSGQPTKNSADIALAINAITDFMDGATQFVAVMSDDSDFIALYAKLRQLTKGNTPFLWVLTDRPGTRSATIRDYFPNDHIHVVSAPVSNGAASASSAAPVPSDDVEDPSEPFAAMAAAIIQELPVGSFTENFLDLIAVCHEHGLSADHQKTLAGSSNGEYGRSRVRQRIGQQTLAPAERAWGQTARNHASQVRNDCGSQGCEIKHPPGEYVWRPHPADGE